MKNKIKQYILVIFGLFLAALSFNLFLSPHNFASGGVGGLAIVFHKLLNIDESKFIFVVNFFLILLSFYILGKETTKNTILGSLLFPVFIHLTEPIVSQIPIENLDYLILAILGGATSGIGLGIVYKNGFTSGGTDILNQIMEKRWKIPMGKSILYVDGIIVLISAVVFGVESMIYSTISLVLISYISNKTILELNQNKVFYIYTAKPKEVKKYLTEDFSYDITIFDTIGGFTEKRKKLFMCSIKAREYYLIKEGILYIDPTAFLIIANAYEQKNANVLLRKNKELTLGQGKC